MATFPDVVSGQLFVPNAQLENHVRHLVNSFQIPGVSGGVSAKNGATIKVSVRNNANSTIFFGNAVNFVLSETDDLEDDIIPCSNVFDLAKPWGVLASTLEPNEIGSCIVSGPVKVKIDNGEGDFVQPDPNNPGVFVLSSKGVPVIFKHNGEAIINLGGGSSSELSHQFKIVASDTNTITVLNGNAPNSSVAGTLNGVDYPTTEFTFQVTDAAYYIYAVDGKIYALKHRFHSDLIPALLIGVVTVAGGTVTIEQRNFSDNPVVPVCGAVYGATELGYSITYANYTLTVKYTVASKIAVNNVVIELTTTDIPATTEGEDGYLYGYVKSLTVDYNTTPESGIVFSADLPEERQWVQTVFSYRLHDNTFRVLSRMENPQNFVFAPFPLNAVEVCV